MSNYTRQLKARFIDSMLCFGFFQKLIGRRWTARWRKEYVLAERELSILPKLFGKNSIVFDVGANRGELSFFFATICNAKEVFSFEPQQRMFGILQGVAGSVKNITPVNIALSDSSEERVLHIPLQATGRYTPAASLEQLSANTLENEMVKVNTLDNFVTEHSITRLDFIKCDTEGHELTVLKGASKTLTSLRPSLYVEVKDTTKKLLFDLLKSKEYRAYQWDNMSSRIFLATDNLQAQSENYYFFPIEKEAILLKNF